jgi:PAS domain S-box-containing protein
VALFWTLVVGTSLTWALLINEREQMNTAYAEARANLNKDITLRRWATDHGGVYVPITEQQKSVPFLSHVPGRDVTTTDGKQLTLLNPASVVRQMIDRYALDYGVTGRITGLKYLNPANAPDDWEKRQLEFFQRGEGKEVWEVTEIAGQPYLRHLRAMYMEDGCDKCHAILGFKTGDLRGATGLNLPLESYYLRIRQARIDLGMTHGLIWLLGIAGIGTASRPLPGRAAELSRAQSIIDSTHDAIVGMDVRGVITTWNPGAERLFGYAGSEVIGVSMRILLPPGQAAEETEILGRMSRGERIERLETVRRHKDGRLIDVAATISPIYDANGNIVGASKIARDITERKRAAMELEHYRNNLEEQVRERTAELTLAKEAAEAANIAKSSFLANMSHEIRTPMNGIMGMVHLLRRDGITARQAQRLDTIDLSARHLLEIINNILDLSKIEAGKLALEEAPVQIDTLLENVRKILADRAKDAGLALRIEPAGALPTLLGDPTRIEQCLLNYAANAIKFTERGAVTIRVATLAETNDSMQLRFEVEDTGIGIEAEAAARLFSAFEQADNSTTRKYGGTGLGLAITKHLAALMGGTAGTESRLGEGSRFWFTAMLKKGLDLPDEKATGPIDAESSLRERFSGRCILVVDDEPINLEVVKMALETTGLQIDTAQDGGDATSLALHKAYDAILMDVQMPNVDGLEATEVIRAIPGYAHTPIIAMTANVFVEDKARCLAAGMNDFLPKPFDPRDLFAILLHGLDAAEKRG